MFETLKLSQEEDSDHVQDPPRGNYSDCLVDESSHTERSDSSQTHQPVVIL